MSVKWPSSTKSARPFVDAIAAGVGVARGGTGGGATSAAGVFILASPAGITHIEAMAPLPRTPARAAWLPWAMWLIGGAFYFFAFFQRTAPSAMVPELMRDFEVSAGALGQLSAYYFYAYAAMQIPTGILSDHWGPRRLLLGATAVAGVGSLLFATADGIAMAAAGRLLIGAGAGFGFVCTLKIVTQWFPARRMALLSGLTMTLGMAGGIAGQGPVAVGVATFGWRPIMVGGAVIAFLGCLVIIAAFRNRPPVAMDGPPGTAAEAPERTGHTQGLVMVMKRPQTWIIAGFGFATATALLAFGGLWAVPYLTQVRGLSRVDAAFAASLVLLGWGLTAPAVGWLSDRIGRRRPVMLASALLATLSVCVLLYTPSLPVAAINGLLLAQGIAVAGVVICFAAAKENNPAEDSGAAMAVVNMTIIASGAIMQPLVGWLLDLGWRGAMADGVRVYDAAAYKSALVVLPLAGLAACVLALLVREAPPRP